MKLTSNTVNRTMLFYIMRNYFISRLASTRLFSPPLFDRYFLPANRPATIHISFYLLGTIYLLKLFSSPPFFSSSFLSLHISFFHFGIRLFCPFSAYEPTFYVTIDSRLSRSYHFHLSNIFYCAIV